MAMMACMGLSETGGGKEEVVLCNDVRLLQGKFPVEDVEELPFYTTDITLAKQSGPCCPVGILR